MDEEIGEQIEQQLAFAESLVDTLLEFLVAYGFQILGAIVILIIGLKVSGWVAGRVVVMCEKRNFDPTLSRFGGNVVRIIMIGIVIIITLGNFGITIAPLIALAGAGAFGLTMALQGPLSNYGAGLAIILTRPFVVKNTIRVRGTYGVVEEIKLSHTELRGDDGELITVPNKEIVGQVLINSQENRIVEPRIFIAAGQDVERAIAAVRGAIEAFPRGEDIPAPQVGVHDFAYGGTVVGARFWVPSETYYQHRYEINQAILEALAKASIDLKASGPVAQAAPQLGSAEETHEGGILG